VTRLLWLLRSLPSNYTECELLIADYAYKPQTYGANAQSFQIRRVSYESGICVFCSLNMPRCGSHCFTTLSQPVSVTQEFLKYDVIDTLAVLFIHCRLILLSSGKFLNVSAKSDN
jgi:hypothetical protein